MFVLQTLWVTLLFLSWSGVDTGGRLDSDKKSPWTGYPATPMITEGEWLTVQSGQSGFFSQGFSVRVGQKAILKQMLV